MVTKAFIVDNNPTSFPFRISAASSSHLYMKFFYILVLIIAVGCEREVVVPQSLSGEWQTSAPGYADRYMKFTKDTLTYGIGNGKEITHKINRIDSEQLDQRTVYTFYYRDTEGDKAILSFFYSPAAGGTIQMKNDNKIWKKAAS